LTSITFFLINCGRRGMLRISMLVLDGRAIRQFITGFILGAIFVITAVIGIASIILIKGVTVKVDADKIAYMVRGYVLKRARIELPQMIEQLEQKVPVLVSSKLNLTDDITLKVSKVEMKLPREIGAQLDKEVKRKVTSMVARSVRSFDTEPVIERLGNSAYDLVRGGLKRELEGKRILIKTSKWFSIPVTVSTR
jgi:hypothetical protein